MRVKALFSDLLDKTAEFVHFNLFPVAVDSLHRLAYPTIFEENAASSHLKEDIFPGFPRLLSPLETVKVPLLIFGACRLALDFVLLLKFLKLLLVKLAFLEVPLLCLHVDQLNVLAAPDERYFNQLNKGVFDLMKVSAHALV